MISDHPPATSYKYSHQILILESLKIIHDKNFIIEGKGKISNKEVIEEFIEEYERMERLYDFNYDEYLKEVERTGIDLN